MRRAIAVALAALALLGGCGGDDGGGGTDTPASPYGGGVPQEAEPEPATPAAPEAEEDERPESAPDPGGEEQLERPLAIEDVIAAVLTRAGSPEQGCEELVTESFVSEGYGDRGGCLAARSDPAALARSVEVSRVDEAGERAIAVAVPDGGPYDGVEVEIELVADPELDGAWLLDSLVADIPAGP